MEEPKPIDTVLEVQDGLIDIAILFNHIDKGIKVEEDKDGKAS
jgi:hypothetical protein